MYARSIDIRNYLLQEKFHKVAAQEIITCLAQRKGIQIADGAFEDYQSFKEKQYDKLADTLRKYLDMNQIYGMLRDADIH